ncbi:MAG: hypothetical protein ACTHU0_39735 [Kofleriaceae bacterium]
MRFWVVWFLAALLSCGDSKEVTPDAPSGPECSDGLDNDGDGDIDYPDDLGCSDASDTSENSPHAPACSDHRDNDGDGKIDYPHDPGCPLALADSEDDDCPDGPECPQCANGRDDDGNGKIDYPEDPGCTAAADRVEFVENPMACGPTLTIKTLPPTGLDSGDLVATSNSTLSTPCGGGGGAAAIAYLMVLDAPAVVVISTVGSTVDTVVDLRRAPCSDAASEIACSDDVSASDDSSKIVESLAPGAYYIIVHGTGTSQTGAYNLVVEKFAGEGEPCAMQSDCGPGLICRIPVNTTAMLCSKPVCSDGLDDDSDGKIDYPYYPGCATPNDATEDDDCPDGASCPDCADGIDNDGDGDLDYPHDASCHAASEVSEACTSTEPVGLITGPITTGNTTGATHDYDPTCNSPTAGLSPDLLYRIELPAMKSLRLNTTGFDTATTLFDSSCGNAIACSDPAVMTVTNLAAGTYYFSVEGYSTTGVGAFTIETSGVIASGGSCEGELFAAGALACEPGFLCDGPAGARTCRTQCTDGIDNNGDGKIDYPLDPGCSSRSDNTEDTVCPGAQCPACSDGLDNDGDGQIDYPMDTTCIAASSPSEACVTSEPIGVIVSAMTTGTTAGQVNDSTPSCGSSTHNAPDLLYQLDLPQMKSLNLTLTGIDGAHSLFDSTCGTPAIACSDPQSMNVGALAAGRYYVSVDAYGTASGSFTLATSGVIAPGGSCENPLFAAGVIACPAGFTCDGAPGARTCRTQCSDGIDNNGDGKTDYPQDPGCSSPADDTEDTVCPGATCPACSDGIDNDGDLLIDYPADTACIAASGVSESCVSSEPIGVITSTTTTGTTAGQVNDSAPTCGSATAHTAPDVLYQIDLPQMQSMSFTLTGFDGAHSLLNSTCGGPPVACSDPQAMNLGALAAGRYFVSIDGYSSASGAFTLTTAGVIAPGGSCESPLYAAGVIACPTGFACDGPGGARTCRTQCSDGIDNNGDGKIDYPQDPGCGSPADNTEDTVCPGAQCPACSDGIDNDGDLAIDYPADTACLAAGGTSESCVSSEPIGLITSGTTTGTTAGQVNDYKPVCGSATAHSAPDVLLQLDIPQMQTLTLNLTGFDGAHSLLDSTCGAAPIACSDPPLMTVNNVSAGRYYVAVDGYGTASGPFTLATSGVVALGGSCEGALFAAGAFTCPTGSTCGGPAGARTCRTQCSDGIDNNGDGRIDFPYDPSCTSLSDNTEVDVCPGVNCPLCGNGIDDDADGAIDFPADIGCTTAISTTEAFCAIEPNYAGAITAPTTHGTLVGAANNYNQTCQSITGNDVAYSLFLPVPVQQLVISTIGSTIADTVISLKDAACGTQLGCDDDGDPAGNLSLLTVNQVSAGNYAIQVDSYNPNGANHGPFRLNVRGTVVRGTACTSPLFASGVLACASGSTCNAGICQ